MFWVILVVGLFAAGYTGYGFWQLKDFDK